MTLLLFIVTNSKDIVGFLLKLLLIMHWSVRDRNTLLHIDLVLVLFF